ncbi:uncharacterized protein CTHT_0008430 [Thermochaetoides thermophila DSM 1495]|uniref:DUF7598 domain-containing protein n=1 Tax=Chaetomium thermophilum (strain DSM 1495 / CBS 144.50 / IMI 039719) TaxID=759272 RepID=G0S019_CHATD|nr:hypothetical protein CTHT_0008430 [Thermochaetoides thermophila DSM 1495]EGS23180.1 hypothetical protein CTHT_0008430 [Thermochaetoides thermophila DSM 1495]
MFSIGQNSKVLGAGHLVLNILRALTMIGLLIVMAAVWAMIVLSILKGHFDFFDTISHVFIFFTSIFLFVSELNLRIFRGWFERNWPVLSQYHSLAWLGIAQIVIGCAVLGDLVKPGYSQETIGLAFWRAIVAAGILSLTFGWFNIFASIIFRIPESNITARMIRSEGSLAPQRAANKTIEDVLPHEYPPSLSHRDHFFPPPPTYFKQPNEEPSRVKRLTQVLNPKNFRKSRIQISKPIPQETSGFEQTQQTASSPKNQFSPIAPEIQRPPSTLHPMYTGSSRYSEAHMSRW